MCTGVDPKLYEQREQAKNHAQVTYAQEQRANKGLLEETQAIEKQTHSRDFTTISSAGHVRDSDTPLARAIGAGEREGGRKREREAEVAPRIGGGGEGDVGKGHGVCASRSSSCSIIICKVTRADDPVASYDLTADLGNGHMYTHKRTCSSASTSVPQVRASGYGRGADGAGLNHPTAHFGGSNRQGVGVGGGESGSFGSRRGGRGARGSDLCLNLGQEARQQPAVVRVKIEPHG